MTASKDGCYQLGIIGYPLTHTFSPTYFNQKFQSLRVQGQYHVWEMSDIAMVESLKSIPHLKGFNVTIPYKTAIIHYLDEIDIQARAVGAVNCVVVEGDKWVGYNTDIIGLNGSLNTLLKSKPALDIRLIKALILGTGGAAKAVAYALTQLDIPFQFVSRKETNECIGYETLTLKDISDHHLIINTTPLGMFPHVNRRPSIPYEGIGSDHLLFDLIYNPSQTAFLKIGEAKGASIANGYQMLITQAEANWDLWFGKEL